MRGEVLPTRKIVVIGGGVAGLSAAHELSERSGLGVDFEIHVFDRRHEAVGGKARSIPVPGSATGGRGPLPGEHGFRFFPGFYKHLPDTMQRIPYGTRTVFDNLVVANRLQLARFDKPPIVIAARFPETLSDLVTDLEAAFGTDTGLLPGEVAFFAERLWQILTSCDARRLAEYEKITWWNYLEATTHSAAYRNLLVEGLSRSLLANDPVRASVRTVGDTNVQLILGLLDPLHPTDRLLNGPTSTVWLEPWRAYLERQGVQFHMAEEAVRFGIAGGLVDGVRFAGPVGEHDVTGDAYVFALPVERMADLLRASKGGADDPLESEPALAGILAICGNVRWMNGIQFFLREDVPMTQGHVLYADSPWALTSVSEAQFWSNEHLPELGDGTVHGVLSACISCWETPGILFGKPAIDCTPQEIAQEVWEQIKRSVNVEGQAILQDANLHSHFLDPDLIDGDTGKVRLRDAEPLFVNFTDSWASRPEAVLPTRNMVLASDYVRSFTDVACMEAANEAARRAVNGLLIALGSSADPCALWPLHEPMLFAPFRWHDQRRFAQGLPWDGHI